MIGESAGGWATFAWAREVATRWPAATVAGWSDAWWTMTSTQVAMKLRRVVTGKHLRIRLCTCCAPAMSALLPSRRLMNITTLIVHEWFLNSNRDMRKPQIRN